MWFVNLWQNLKMKISRPRFLSIGNREDLNLEIPDCLEKKMNFERNDVPADSKKVTHGVFLFPEVCVEVHVLLSFGKYQQFNILGAFMFYICVGFSGHPNKPGKTFIMASMASSCCSWNHFLIYSYIL